MRYLPTLILHMALLMSPRLAAQQPTPAAAAQPPQLTPEQASHARAGLVEVIKAGQMSGRGFVLVRDGRIITTATAVTGTTTVKVRYSDGTLSNATVEATDLAWNVALLTPSTKRGENGLSAGTSLQLTHGTVLFAPKGRGTAQTWQPVSVGSRETLVGGGGTLLPNALLVQPPTAAFSMGSPLMDPSGSVVGILSQAKTTKDGAKPATHIVPAERIRSFVLATRSPSPDLITKPEETAYGKGLRIVTVPPGHPLATAGLLAQDLLLAIDGVPTRTADSLITRPIPKDRAVQLILVRGDRFIVLVSNQKFTPKPKTVSK